MVKRPTGVNVIIAVSIPSIMVSIALNLYLGLVRRMPVIFINAPFILLAIAGIVGLWLMRRWGFWLAIASSIVSLIMGFLNTAMLFDLMPHFPILPQFGRIADILLLSFSGPIGILISIVYLSYFYRIRMVWRTPH